ncbi:hypothetical protein HALLA_02940 (plasmid) [Halostagnicola larsenii XH-48]|uniref:Uncharacterized protein n=1 Tax=Halostagnicola larsenii XH-48 TaxID=797299 RepID=W0JRL4_9EURY|nr:hypothetical protein [Halostagnicola larsenii]AHG01356.1 hypothetical protein HALLA_02940 [Halostagnicola larsenii XH-48]
MTELNRHEAVIQDGILYIDREQDPLEVGSMDDVVDLFGGETYRIEYTDRQSATAWLSTDDENGIDIDVRDSLEDWAYPEELVTNVADSPLEETDEDGYPMRTSVFVDMVTAIWDAKGNLEG